MFRPTARFFHQIARPAFFPGPKIYRTFATHSPSADSILRALSVIIDPDLNRDIVSLGFVKNLNISQTGLVKFDLELTTPACPVKEQFVEACQSILKSEFPEVKDVKVTLTAQKRQAAGPSESSLKSVNAIVAVASCKGGVGKSSVATNLAMMLAKEYDCKVGLLDADIYGPSLPTLLPGVRRADMVHGMPQQIQAFAKEVHRTHGEFNTVKLMSMGYLRPGESAALRGPMASGMIQQLLTLTGWGELDYLIIDMPPGTGDIQLTVAQHAKIDGAVVVTTPQQLSLVDVEKGVDLWNKMKIPNLAIVENMAYFKCDSCDKKHSVFGTAGDAAKIAEKFGIEHVVQLPLEGVVASKGPFVLQDENSSSLSYQAIRELADVVVRVVAKVKFGATDFSLVSGDGKLEALEKRQDGVVSWRGVVDPRKLRLACKSATMIDEWTGKTLFDEKKIPSDVKPIKVETAGKYAVRVDWSDGHHSIYPIKAIKELCEAGSDHAAADVAL